MNNNQMRIIIDARRIHFDFTLPKDKQVIILQGESGTYKTTLFDVLEHYSCYRKYCGITVECEKGIRFIGYDTWEDYRDIYLVEKSNQLLFIYEGCDFFNDPEFPKTIRKNKTNQYVIIT